MNSLSIVESKGMTIWESNTDLSQIKEIYGKNLSSGEFSTLVQMGKATGLNPFLKEIWAVKYGNNPAQIFIGRDGYRKSAQRSPHYDFHIADAVYSNDEFDVENGSVHHKYNLRDRGFLVGAYCSVLRKGSSRPTYIYVDLGEYNKGQSVWKEKPATMIKKVAEAQGLRMAFQELFSGTYSEYEKWDDKESSNIKSKNGVTALKEKLSIIDVDASQVDVREESINADTGEINPTEKTKATFEEVSEKLKSARNIQELNLAISLTTDLVASEKVKAHKIYRERQEDLKELNDVPF